MVLEEVIVTMPLWQKLAAYAYLLIGLFIFVKTSKLQLGGYPIIALKWRVALAVLFPVILVLGAAAGIILLGVAIAFFGLIALTSMLTGKKISRPKLPRLRINVIRK